MKRTKSIKTEKTSSMLMAARVAIKVAEVQAEKYGLSLAIVVVNTHAEVIASEKQDAALPMNMQYAQWKAVTAGSLGLTTRQLRADAQPGKVFYGIETGQIAGNKITLLDGGAPIVVENKLVGGIGIGSTVMKRKANQHNDVDQVIAQEAVKAFVKAFTSLS